MNRRDLIKQSSVMIGGMVFPGLAVLFQGCGIEYAGDYQPGYLSEKQFQFIAAIAETVIPRTETAGAGDAGVAPYIDLLFGQYFEEEVGHRHQQELNRLIEQCQQSFGSDFSDIGRKNQEDFLDAIDADEESFFRYLKNLMLWAFFTSEQGIESLDYNPIPGKYQGCKMFEDTVKNQVGNCTWNFGLGNEQ